MEIKDVFGIEPIGQMGLEVTKATISGISSFLNMVFKPGLQELGYLFEDKVRRWRLNNILRVLEKAKGKMDFDGAQLNLTANARVGLSIMEECSSVDNDELQDLWAGLFVSSCTPDGRDDSNMNFVDLLRRMSTVEARILDYACNNSKKYLYPNKLIVAETLNVPFDTLVTITGTNDIYRLDSELDHMRSIELFPHGDSFGRGGGFSVGDNQLDADITPSSLALNLYFRTHSTGISPVEFWGEQLIHRDQNDDNEKIKAEIDKIFSES